MNPLTLQVRFFMWDADAGGGDMIECTEQDFLEAEGEIEYERHTVRENGCSQICLTKNPFSNGRKPYDTD